MFQTLNPKPYALNPKKYGILPASSMEPFQELQGLELSSGLPSEGFFKGGYRVYRDIIGVI